MRPKFYGRLTYVLIILIVIVVTAAGIVGQALGSGVLHPASLNPKRNSQAEAMLLRTGASKEDFRVRAQGGIQLRGWKVRAQTPNGNWILLFHGVSDNRTGVLGHAELFRLATILAMQGIAKAGGFNPDNVSPEKAVAARSFPTLLICGTRDHRIPCRHAERIYRASRGERELWVVAGAGHAGGSGPCPRRI
jgi:pimeloyl-ACP methyl ester carboxylesterase